MLICLVTGERRLVARDIAVEPRVASQEGTGARRKELFAMVAGAVKK